MQAKKTTFHALTGLRFIAAFLVIWHHGHRWLPEGYECKLAALGVSFFFSLSGFVLFYNYHDREFNLNFLKKFYYDRIARIWPTHLLGLILFIIVFKSQEVDFIYITRLLSNAFLLHTWVPNDLYNLSFNGPSWSISTELFFYLSFPFIVIGYKANRIITAILIAIVALIPAIIAAKMALTIPIKFGVDQFSYGAVTRFFPVSRLFEFFCGILICDLYFLLKKKNYEDVARKIEIPLLILAGAYLYYLINYRINFGDKYSTILFQTSFKWIPLSLLLLVTFSTSSSVITKFLSSKPMRLLGESSFSLYLLHTPVKIFCLKNLKGFKTFDSVEGIKYFVIWALISILISILAHKCFEMPVNKALKKAYGKIKTSKSGTSA